MIFLSARENKRLSTYTMLDLIGMSDNQDRKARNENFCFQLNAYCGEHLVFRSKKNQDNSPCGLVVRATSYRSRGPDSVPGAARIFLEVVGLVRGPFSFVSTLRSYLKEKSSGSYLESRECGCRDPSQWPCGTL
jgi:hypothetical protein